MKTFNQEAVKILRRDLDVSPQFNSSPMYQGSTLTTMLLAVLERETNRNASRTPTYAFYPEGIFPGIRVLKLSWKGLEFLLGEDPSQFSWCTVGAKGKVEKVCSALREVMNCFSTNRTGILPLSKHIAVQFTSKMEARVFGQQPTPVVSRWYKWWCHPHLLTTC